MGEQQDEGLMDKIHALVAPPQSITAGKQKGKKSRVNTSSNTSSTQQKHGGIENNPFCNACGDGGSLLCCDNCPASFHFYCCDPPVDPRNLPSGDWLCRSCTSTPVPNTTPSLFKPLLEQATSSNPLIFTIPEELKSTELLPGQSKKKCVGHRKIEEKECSVKHCYACNRRIQPLHLAQCDFCPLHFHLSCVDPPLTTPPLTAWMCPLHPHHSIPDFEHPRLSRRLRALEKGRQKVEHHNVKFDFLSKINRIPHYKRVTRHLKRKATEVPSAIKTLYSDPMPEVYETPPISESLVCAAEICQWWRNEESKRRREFTAITTLTPSSPTSHHQDQWTRTAVAKQLNNDTSPTVTHNHDTPNLHDNSLHDDPAVLIAANHLLELSKRQTINGVTKTQINNFKIQELNFKEKVEEESMLSTEPDSDIDKRGGVTSVGVASVGGEGDKVMMINGYGDDKMELENDEDNEREKAMEAEECNERETMMINTTTDDDIKLNDACRVSPDISLLDPRLVQLLASQRLQQLFGSNRGNSSRGDDKMTESSSSPSCQSNHSSFNKTINGMQSNLLSQPTKPVLTEEKLREAHSVLCPVSGIGTAHAVDKYVTIVGTGSGVDVCLMEYGHCNYLSPRHACIFFNKVTGEYELLNYSDHGSVVDGVLYSCDFSDKTVADNTTTTTNTSPQTSTNHHHHISPNKASDMIENARLKLKDQTTARRALEGALNLSKHSASQDNTLEPSTGGTRRTTYNSSVVSIPLVLSRTKKLNAGVPSNVVSSMNESKKTVGTAASGSTPTTPDNKLSQTDTNILCTGPPSTPCLCRRSASCLVGSNRKGWEGTATLYHGTRLRFGCLQFVFSVAGRPGHSELLDSLSPLLHINT